MTDRWFYIIASIVVGVVIVISLMVTYAATANTNSTERAKARISVCKTLPSTSDVIFCLEHAG